MQPAFVIYSQKSSKRLLYILEYFFKNLLLCEYIHTTDREIYEKAEGIKLNYSLKRILEDELHVVNIGLLFQIGIKEQNIQVEKNSEGLPYFYSTNEKSDIPFDIFAASFYLLSRYEEYLPYSPDSYGRFPAKASLAYQNGFLSRPLIEEYALLLKKIFTKIHPEINWPKKPYQFVPTYDIDAAYSMRSKGLVRTIGGFLSSLMRRDFKEFVRRINVILAREKDPFDNFDYMIALQKRYATNTKCFFLVGDYGEYDKNISLQVNDFKYLIKSINDYMHVGLHPSYASGSDYEILKMEKIRLEEVLNTNIVASRQHFLKLNVPRTYQRLIELEFEEDYTMGYASEIGFRASTSTPFYFYDLDYEVQTKLKVVPFAVMDVTLNLYSNFLPDEAIAKTRLLVESVRDVGGQFSLIWHNQNLSNEKEWKGWKRVFEEIIKSAV